MGGRAVLSVTLKDNSYEKILVTMAHVRYAGRDAHYADRVQEREIRSSHGVQGQVRKQDGQLHQDGQRLSA